MIRVICYVVWVNRFNFLIVRWFFNYLRFCWDISRRRFIYWDICWRAFWRRWLLWLFWFIWRRIRLFWIFTFIYRFYFWAFCWRRYGLGKFFSIVFSFGLYLGLLFMRFRLVNLIFRNLCFGVEVFIRSWFRDFWCVILFRFFSFRVRVLIFSIFYWFCLSFNNFICLIFWRCWVVWFGIQVLSQDWIFFDHRLLYRFYVSIPYVVKLFFPWWNLIVNFFYH